MRTNSVSKAFKRLMSQNMLGLTDRMLVIGGGAADAELMQSLGFTDVTILNINAEIEQQIGGYKFVQGDAHTLTFDDGAFDVVFTSDCLHHCRSPHRVLTEMYRVACKAVIVVESCDNLMMRLAIRLGYTYAYELHAKNMRGQGGVDFGAIPNFVYRWREEEFEKTIRCFDPTIDQKFLYFYDFNLPERRLRGNSLKARVGRALASAVRFAARLMPRQGNTLAMVAYKDPENCPVHPWLRWDAGSLVPNPEYYESNARLRNSSLSNFSARGRPSFGL